MGTKWLLYSRTNKDKYTNIYQNQTHFDSKNKNKKISFLSRSQQLKNSAGHRNGSLPGYDLRRIVVLPIRIVTVKTIWMMKVHFESEHDAPPWGRHRPCPWKTILAAITLFATGTICILHGARELTYYDGERGRALLTLGSLCFLPGSYASYILYGAYRRWPGFRWNQIPSYDDWLYDAIYFERKAISGINGMLKETILATKSLFELEISRQLFKPGGARTAL